MWLGLWLGPSHGAGLRLLGILRLASVSVALRLGLLGRGFLTLLITMLLATAARLPATTALVALVALGWRAAPLIARTSLVATIAIARTISSRIATSALIPC